MGGGQHAGALLPQDDGPAQLALDLAGQGQRLPDLEALEAALRDDPEVARGPQGLVGGDGGRGWKGKRGTKCQ